MYRTNYRDTARTQHQSVPSESRADFTCRRLELPFGFERNVRSLVRIENEVTFVLL
jgi:hypothetical protein